MFEKFMNGLLGTAPTGENGQPVYDQRVTEMADTYGMPASQIQRMQQDQRSQMLLKVGSTLLGASQAGPVGQRGRILSQLGDAFTGEADMTKQIMNSAQARLYAESLKEKQGERQARAEFFKGLKAGTLDIDPAVADRLKLLGPKSYDAYQTYIASSLKGKEYGPLQIDPVTKKPYQLGSNGEYKWAPTSGVTINTGPEKARDGIVGKNEGEAEIALTNAEQNAMKKQAQLTSLATMTDIIGKDQGKFFEMKSGLAEALRGFGVDDKTIGTIVGMDPRKAGLGQAVSKMASEALMGKIGTEFPAQNFSNADLEFLKQSYIQLSNNPDANRLILEMERRKAQADIDAGRDFRAWRKTNKDGTVADWRDDYNKRLNDPDKPMNRFADINEEMRRTVGDTKTVPGAASGAVLTPGSAPAAVPSQQGAVAPAPTTLPEAARGIEVPTMKPQRGQPPEVQRALTDAQVFMKNNPHVPREAVMQRLRQNGIIVLEGAI